MNFIIVTNKLKRGYNYDLDFNSPLGCLAKPFFNTIMKDHNPNKHPLFTNQFVYWFEDKLILNIKKRFGVTLMSHDISKLNKLSVEADRYSRREKSFLSWMERHQIPFVLKDKFEEHKNTNIPVVRIPKIIIDSTMCDENKHMCALGVLTHCTGVPIKNIQGKVGTFDNVVHPKLGTINISYLIEKKYGLDDYTQENIMTDNDDVNNNSELRRELFKNSLIDNGIPYKCAI